MTNHTTPDTTALDIAVRAHAHDASHLEHNTTLHDLYRKECARLFMPGTSTYSTLREIRGV